MLHILKENMSIKQRPLTYNSFDIINNTFKRIHLTRHTKLTDNTFVQVRCKYDHSRNSICNGGEVERGQGYTEGDQGAGSGSRIQCN
jgi:hypothetical protein